MKVKAIISLAFLNSFCDGDILHWFAEATEANGLKIKFFT